MIKIVLTVFALAVFIENVPTLYDTTQVRGGEDRKGTFNKYEEPYQYWFTIPNP